MTQYNIDEIWKDIEGYNGKYKVSSYGRVKSLARVGSIIILKPQTCSGGYTIVRLSGKTKRVHRLVAIAFLVNQYNKPEVNHIDSNKKNNHLSNLEWVTSKENSEHAMLKGNKSPLTKLNAHSVRQIRTMRSSGMLNKDIAKILSVSNNTIRRVTANVAWQYII